MCGRDHEVRIHTAWNIPSHPLSTPDSDSSGRAAKVPRGFVQNRPNPWSTKQVFHGCRIFRLAAQRCFQRFQSAHSKRNGFTADNLPAAGHFKCFARALGRGVQEFGCRGCAECATLILGSSTAFPAPSGGEGGGPLPLPAPPLPDAPQDEGAHSVVVATPLALVPIPRRGRGRPKRGEEQLSMEDPPFDPP